MSPTDGDIEYLQLAHRVQSLPRELYDEICNFTFTTNDEYIRVLGDYTPPSTLGVSKATRAKAAETYFSTPTFCVGSRSALLKWLLSLPTKHLVHLRKIHWDIHEPGAGDVECEASDLERVLRDVGLQRLKDVIFVEVRCEKYAAWERVNLDVASAPDLMFRQCKASCS